MWQLFIEVDVICYCRLVTLRFILCKTDTVRFLNAHYPGQVIFLTYTWYVFGKRFPLLGIMVGSRWLRFGELF